jgi:hypothetical protein
MRDAMTEQAPPVSRHDLEAKIVKRCWEDEEFRKEFTANPADAFVKYLQIPAASLPKVWVHSEEPGSWHIVLPVKPAKASELSEEDLEKVAGGNMGTPAVSAHVTSAYITVGTIIAASETILEGGW